MNLEFDGQFGNYQNEIYFEGLSGVLPTMPMTFEELEARAQAVLSPSLLSYVAGGAGDESTQRATVSAFQRWGLVLRMMVGATRRDLSVDLFGMSLPSPLFMAPVGVIGLCAQDGHGDLATARAAARTGVPMVASTLSVDPLEQFGETPGFFALYSSNHGGRQANGGLAALDALPTVLEAAEGLPVLFDSGVRSGVDVIKALALGATAVGVGRPYAYGLALEGTDGIVHVLRSLLAEADLIMAVDGYPCVKDLRVDGAMRRISFAPGQPVPRPAPLRPLPPAAAR